MPDRGFVVAEPESAFGADPVDFAGELCALKKLELVSARPTSSGVIIATYRPVR
ncbi:hypothetical protein LO772_30870 [Yinghuangia sp. ASG 101]|uniref:hypothetical protein n=1 Tax=Yinghuangia sp. ASG 101 TaxID=2896848 RepID=UPI001E444CFC|nr:hypothetical protein [Yinghuangia sp. ASG 101]UGQ11159.1 hypothetical protein LO772_30870 [Yinghuangia sp. ASG 101]